MLCYLDIYISDGGGYSYRVSFTLCTRSGVWFTAGASNFISSPEPPDRLWSPNPPPIQWVRGSFPGGVESPGREADNSPPSCAEVKNEWNSTSASPIKIWHEIFGDVDWNFKLVHRLYGGTRCCSWLRHGATSRKVAGSNPDGVIGFFHWHNPSGRIMTLGSTQPLTEMSTRNISWG